MFFLYGLFCLKVFWIRFFCFTKDYHMVQNMTKWALLWVEQGNRNFFICLIESIQCFDKESKKIFSIAIFLPPVLTCQKREISLPVSYKTAPAKTEDWEWLWRHFRTFYFAVWSFLPVTTLLVIHKEMVQKCVVYGCSNTKDEKKGISIHTIPFFKWTQMIWALRHIVSQKTSVDKNRLNFISFLHPLYSCSPPQ